MAIAHMLDPFYSDAPQHLFVPELPAPVPARVVPTVLPTDMPGPPQFAFNEPPPTKQFAAEVVRATGKGPFDAAFRQNLATFAGGDFQRGMLGAGGATGLWFDPTSRNPFTGPALGFGNAPLFGMPSTLLEAAQGTTIDKIQFKPSQVFALPEPFKIPVSYGLGGAINQARMNQGKQPLFFF